MIEAEIKAFIQRELPRAITEDPSIRDFVLRTVSEFYAPRTEFDQRFDRVLTELQRDREEQALKWEEHNRRFDAFQAEQARKWDKQDRQNEVLLQEIRQMYRKHDSMIGALGSRWGLYSEASFRSGLKAILEDSFGVQVLNLNLYDHGGEVFGRPDQVEIDLIIKNGTTIACEIKSSIDKAGMYIFGRKADFYAKHENRTIDRKIVISPMVDERAKPVAEALGIELYSYADTMENL